VAAPSAVWAVAGGLVRVAVRGPEELRRTLDLLERAQDLLSVLEPPVRRVAVQVDDRLVDDLVLSVRAAPALVATATRAVGEFDLFVDYAQGARAAADRLLADLAVVLRRTEAAVSGTERVLARIDPVVVGVEGTVTRADAVVARAAGTADVADGVVSQVSATARVADKLLARVSGTAEVADGLVARVSGTAEVADGLVARVSGTADSADALVTRVSGTVGTAEALVGDVDALLQRVGLVVQLAEALAGAAQGLVDDAVDLAGRARPAVEQAAELGEQLVDPATALVPVVREQAPAVAAMLPDLVQSLGQLVDPAAALVPVVREQAPAVAAMLPDLVQSLSHLVADLPELLRRIDADVLPTLHSLRTTPGDVRALRDTVADIEPLVGDVEAELAGLPGSGLLRRRGRKADVEEPAPAAPGPAQPAPQ
jgi:ABC-type transporter Mla subunit MlaD